MATATANKNNWTASICRTQPSGGWECTCICYGFMITQRYFGFSKKSAKALFALHLRERMRDYTMILEWCDLSKGGAA